MRNKFPGYCRLTEEEFVKLWEHCLFVFDANVLLNLYRYTPETKDSFIDIMQRVLNRIWLPYQAAFEYQRGRIAVIQQQSKAYDEIFKLVKKEHEALSGELKKYTKHPSIRVTGILEILNESLTKIKTTMEQLKISHPDFLEDDPIQTVVLELFDGKVGDQTSPEELLDIYKQGEERYRQKKPPGYVDNRKEGIDKYGDLVIWFQMIAKAKENRLPMILVTDDRKEDWWLKIEGKAIGPHPELVQEFSTKTGMTFYMYSPDPFMEHAGKYLKYEVEKKAITEVREVRQEDEVLRRHAKEEALMRALNASNGVLDELRRRRAREEALWRGLNPSVFSGSATDGALRQLQEREELIRRFAGSSSSSRAADEIMRWRDMEEASLRDLNPPGSARVADEIMRWRDMKEASLRDLNPPGSSRLIDEILRQEAIKEASLRDFDSPCSSGSATDGILKQTKDTENPDET